MAYSKNAFNCSRCPGKGGDGGCPMWWETIHENITDGNTKIIKGCGYEQLPIYLIEVIKASNRPAAAVESTRNEIAKGFQNVGIVLETILLPIHKQPMQIVNDETTS